MWNRSLIFVYRPPLAETYGWGDILSISTQLLLKEFIKANRPFHQSESVKLEHKT